MSADAQAKNAFRKRSQIAMSRAIDSQPVVAFDLLANRSLHVQKRSEQPRPAPQRRLINCRERRQEFRFFGAIEPRLRIEVQMVDSMIVLTICRFETLPIARSCREETCLQRQPPYAPCEMGRWRANSPRARANLHGHDQLDRTERR